MKMYDSPVSVLQNTHDLSDEQLIALLQTDKFDRELYFFC